MTMEKTATPSDPLRELLQSWQDKAQISNPAVVAALYATIANKLESAISAHDAQIASSTLNNALTLGNDGKALAISPEMHEWLAKHDAQIMSDTLGAAAAAFPYVYEKLSDCNELECDHTCREQHAAIRTILALTSASVAAHRASRDAAARLAEAEWWQRRYSPSLGRGDHGICSCADCERIAELRAASKGQRA